MATGRLLISFAHPDDESFGLGALIARYIAEGKEVYYVCATNGDVGTVKPEFLEGYSSIAELRLAELDKAAKVLGLTDVILLNYKDSGMMGSETSTDPACLWQAPPDDVTRRMVDVIRDIQPQVVITFNKYGGYGHPDHIAIQKATTEAFFKAGDLDHLTDLAPYKPQKLYYSSIPKRQIQMGILLLRLQRQDPRRMGRNHDIDIQAVVDHAEHIHTKVDVSGYFDEWAEASKCHASQLGGRSTPRLPENLRKRIFGKQGFTRVYPPPPMNRVDESDLFQNVKLDERTRTPALSPVPSP
jgi:LmbE family N-acetylglucosaminyl deacetylase